MTSMLAEPQRQPTSDTWVSRLPPNPPAWGSSGVAGEPGVRALTEGPKTQKHAERGHRYQ